MLNNIKLQIILTTDNTSSKPTLFVDWTIVILKKKDIDGSVEYYIETSKENDCICMSLSDSQSNFRLNW